VELGKEGQLIKAMMSNYDTLIRPTNLSNPVVVVALGLAMTEIAELVNISTDCKFLMFYFCTLNVRK
jgi:hypothetical protein